MSTSTSEKQGRRRHSKSAIIATVISVVVLLIGLVGMGLWFYNVRPSSAWSFCALATASIFRLLCDGVEDLSVFTWAFATFVRVAFTACEV
ncbi:hypothetical protein HPB47_024382 [Ixodes persulcatus]|uniref:Uncharacterized protein n=1 Tax=Ixodes persulcatus TaxID=34615 RepID=A0AC60Q5M1_IXOPE|nr:hypothetical protein HPB47_024382 [Ixodes persulcatus]